MQTGTPAEVSERPRSHYLAELLGLNLYRGSAAGGRVATESGAVIIVADDLEGDVFVAIEPRHLRLHRDHPGAGLTNQWEGASPASTTRAPP